MAITNLIIEQFKTMLVVLICVLFGILTLILIGLKNLNSNKFLQFLLYICLSLIHSVNFYMCIHVNFIFHILLIRSTVSCSIPGPQNEGEAQPQVLMALENKASRNKKEQYYAAVHKGISPHMADHIPGNIQIN